MAEIKSNAASVEFRNITKIYGKSKTPAVDDISLTIEAGKLVTLLGPSGCGKTTTLRMIAGLEMATSGQILIGGAEVTRLPATDRDVSMVFQSYALFPHMTVDENVRYGLRFSGYARKEVIDRASAGLELVGLSGFGDRLPSQLSGGQQQRVAVARALVLEPQVLLFDEPLSNLDAKLRRHVREEIREIQQKLGLTVVYVTHDQEEALAVSDRIIVMNKAGLGPIVLTLPARDLNVGPAQLAVRPNRLSIVPRDTPNALPATISKAIYVGSEMEYVMETGLQPVFVISTAVDKPHHVGETVALAFSQTGPVLIKN